MVAGLERITCGEIRVDGVGVNDVPPRDRDIAMVFQNYALYPHMDVFDNIGFGLRMRHVPKAERRRRVEQVAGILGCATTSNESQASSRVVSGSASPWDAPS